MTGPVPVRESVIQAVVARLSAVTVGDRAVPVHRARRKEVPEHDLPAIILHTSPGVSEPLCAGVTRCRERLRVEAQMRVVAETADADTDAALDTALVALESAVRAALESDETLGGVAVTLTHTDADQTAADGTGLGPLGAILAAYDVEYWHVTGDPFTAAP